MSGAAIITSDGARRHYGASGAVAMCRDVDWFCCEQRAIGRALFQVIPSVSFGWDECGAWRYWREWVQPGDPIDTTWVPTAARLADPLSSANWNSFWLRETSRAAVETYTRARHDAETPDRGTFTLNGISFYNHEPGGVPVSLLSRTGPTTRISSHFRAYLARFNVGLFPQVARAYDCRVGGFCDPAQGEEVLYDTDTELFNALWNYAEDGPEVWRLDPVSPVYVWANLEFPGEHESIADATQSISVGTVCGELEIWYRASSYLPASGLWYDGPKRLTSLWWESPFVQRFPLKLIRQADPENDPPLSARFEQVRAGYRFASGGWIVNPNGPCLLNELVDETAVAANTYDDVGSSIRGIVEMIDAAPE